MKSEETQIKGPRLEKPVRITEQVWPQGMLPVVSICCITYQHLNFIRDAIEGFLMQETTFPVEIIIRDDASSDGTAEIVREYQEKFPQLIRTILHTENQYSNGKKAFPETFAMVRGEFIAICEGDDYWISKEKLQKQLEFLDQNSEFSACFHTVYREDQSDFRPEIPGPIYQRTLYFEDFCKESIFNTCSLIFRRAFLTGSEKFTAQCPVGDWPLFLYLSNQLPIGCIPEPLGVYRIHSSGMYSGATIPKRCKLKVQVLDSVIAQFAKRDVSVALAERKSLFWRRSLAEFQEGMRAAALVSFLQYFLSAPQRFSLPENQKRSVAKMLSPRFLWPLFATSS